MTTLTQPMWQQTINGGWTPPALPAPYSGNQYFVDETNGSDGNPGTVDAPLKTLSQAHTNCTSGNNDVVFFTGTIHLTATLTWSKSQTHLIGICEPIRRGKRARISSSGSTAFTPLVSVTGSGCHFRNFGTFYGFNANSANNAVCWSAAGERNFYDNVEFLGFGDNTASTGTANRTAARACVVGGAGGAGENTFSNCVFGVDTTTRDAANYTLEFLSGSATPRNTFLDCDFEALIGSSGTASSHLYAAAVGTLDRYTVFRGCRFHNAIKSTASAMAQLANLSASVGGYILMDYCTTVGVTKIETTPTNQIYVNSPIVSASTSVYALNNA